MINKGNFDKKRTEIGKILGGDSRIDSLTKLRKKLVDNLVLNSHEQSTEDKKKKEKGKI